MVKTIRTLYGQRRISNLSRRNVIFLSVRTHIILTDHSGKGCIIHISDFINPERGRLVLHDKDGNITHDARVIIYPGANGDPWWDCQQLLIQVEDAIKIFELAFPGKQALFVFDNSSAHGSLAPDSLKAFEMNKDLF